MPGAVSCDVGTCVGTCVKVRVGYLLAGGLVRGFVGGLVVGNIVVTFATVGSLHKHMSAKVHLPVFVPAIFIFGLSYLSNKNLCTA